MVTLSSPGLLLYLTPFDRVEQHLLDAGGVGDDLLPAVVVAVHETFARWPGAEQLQALVDRSPRSRWRVQAQFTRLHPGQVQHLVDQFQQVFSAGVDLLQVVCWR